MGKQRTLGDTSLGNERRKKGGKSIVADASKVLTEDNFAIRR